jgi:hypothetical protein
VGYWIIPLTWVIYMMVANILIVNVLIAVFNGIYSEVDAIAVEVRSQLCTGIVLCDPRRFQTNLA